MVVAAYGERVESPVSDERCKHRLGLEESGSPFTGIPTLSKVLETLFDVLEVILISTSLRRNLLTCLQVLRYLRLHRNVLHRDISSGNVLYVKNLSNRPLPNPPAQEAETNGLRLCYSKKLLGERYVCI